MKLPVVLRPAAKADLRNARDWYERQRSALGELFVDAADQALERIGAMPRLHANVFEDVRLVKVKGYPYIVYYRVQTTRVEVIAILHASRDSRVWQDRL